MRRLPQTPDPHHDDPAPETPVPGMPAPQDPAPEDPAPEDDTDQQDAAPRGHERWRRVVRGLHRYGLTPLVGLIGAIIGLLLVPPTSVDVGPLNATVQMRPSVHAETAIVLPPAGEVVFDSHRAPIRIEARVSSVDIGAAQDLLYDAESRRALERDVPEDLARAAAVNALLNALFATAGAGIGIALTYRRLRRTLIGAGATLGVVVASTGLLAATFRTESLTQPRFEGLLSQAAYVADLGEVTAANYENYRATLAEFVGQVSALYVAADSLPIAQDRADLITVLHVSDIHDNPQAYDVIDQLDEQFDLDLVIDTGDIVSWGTGLEDTLLRRIGTLDVPYVFVSGNHDGAGASAAVAANDNATVLENEVVTLEGLTIAGIGDPRFAADDDSTGTGWQAGKDAVSGAGFQLGDTITEWDEENPDDPVDIALLHDPTEPDGLLGRSPLVLSGHMHTSDVELDREGSGTDWLTVGSTGGALASGGVRPVLEGEDPLDLTARMLYFDRSTQDLVAYDDITMGGLGLVSVSIERHQLPDEETELEIPEDAETPEEPIPDDQQVDPGEGLPDDERVTPPDAESPPPTETPTTEDDEDADD